MELDRNGLRILRRADCLALLGGARVGRIALSHNAMPIILPVMYGVEAEVIVFRADGGLLAEAARRGDVVCFETDSGDDVAGGLWSVLVLGKLEGNGQLVSLPTTILTGRSASAVMSIAGAVT